MSVSIDENIEYWRHRASNLMKRQDYAGAIKALDRALELDGAAADAWNKKGVALLWLDQYAAAIAALRRAIELDPRSTKARANLAGAFMIVGGAEQALVTIEEALGINRRDPDLWRTKGRILEAVGRADDAAEAGRVADALLKAPEPRPRTKGSRRHVLRSVFSAGMILAALFVLANTTYAGLYTQGRIMLFVDEHDDAERLFDKAAAMDGDRPWAFYGKALDLERRGRTREAIDAYQEALLRDEQFFPALMRLGRLHLWADEPKEAYAVFDMATMARPRSAAAWTAKAHVLADLGAANDAIKAAETALEHDPKADEAWVAKGRALSQKKKPKGALAAFNEALAMNKLNRNAAYEKGIMLAGGGDAIEAGRLLAEASERTPRRFEEVVRLAEAFHGIGRCMDGCRIYETAIERRPGLAWERGAELLAQLEICEPGCAAKERLGKRLGKRNAAVIKRRH